MISMAKASCANHRPPNPLPTLPLPPHQHHCQCRRPLPCWLLPDNDKRRGATTLPIATAIVNVTAPTLPLHWPPPPRRRSRPSRGLSNACIGRGRNLMSLRPQGRSQRWWLRQRRCIGEGERPGEGKGGWWTFVRMTFGLAEWREGGGGGRRWWRRSTVFWQCAGRSGLGYTLADSGRLSPRGLGCALTDLGCAPWLGLCPCSLGLHPCGLGCALANSDRLSPCGLGCALADLGCALVAWAAPAQTWAASLWLRLRPRRLGRTVPSCPCGLGCGGGSSGGGSGSGSSDSCCGIGCGSSRGAP